MFTPFNQVKFGIAQGWLVDHPMLWEEYQSVLLRALQKEFDDGWEPITEVGPSAFKLRSYEKRSPIDGGDLVGYVLTFGITLVFDIIGRAKRTYYEPTEFRVALRKK